MQNKSLSSSSNNLSHHRLSSSIDSSPDQWSKLETQTLIWAQNDSSASIGEEEFNLWRVGSPGEERAFHPWRRTGSGGNRLKVCGAAGGAADEGFSFLFFSQMKPGEPLVPELFISAPALHFQKLLELINGRRETMFSPSDLHTGCVSVVFLFYSGGKNSLL